jgi:hypothetical protein
MVSYYKYSQKHITKYQMDKCDEKTLDKTSYVIYQSQNIEWFKPFSTKTYTCTYITKRENISSMWDN